jgi:hypothetical protein
VSDEEGRRITPDSEVGGVVLVLDLWDLGAEKESPILRQLFCSISLTARYAEFIEDEYEHDFSTSAIRIN